MALMFSYGTLQEQVVASTGKTPHANVTYNGRSDSRVSGVAFMITDAELAAADQYEQHAVYTRMAVTLASGRQACIWVHGE